MGKLTALEVKAAVKSGAPRTIGDGDGSRLFLRIVRPNRAKWLLRYTVARKSREMGLGAIRCVGEKVIGTTLAKARELAAAANAELEAGRDPIDQRRARREPDKPAITFAEAARQYIEAQRA